MPSVLVVCRAFGAGAVIYFLFFGGAKNKHQCRYLKRCSHGARAIDTP